MHATVHRGTRRYLLFLFLPILNVVQDRVKAIEEQLLNGPFKGRLSIAGNSYYGVGVNDCVFHAQKAADAIIAQQD